LEKVWSRYHRPELLASDPIEFVHRFKDPWDQEVVALIAAQLAYGNVKQIRRSVEDWLARVRKSHGSPSAWVREGGELRGFVHRLHRDEDLSALSALLRRSWELHGSLGAHLASRLGPDDPTFEAALNAVLKDWKSWHLERTGRAPSRSLSHLLSAPEQGSCCKRWCMLLRWMGRSDDLDPGLWMRGSPLLGPEQAGLRPDQLVLPLDTHVGRISQYLGLTRRKSLNWKAAIEITAQLRRIDPVDPVRYDFALARLGILDLCRNRYVPEVCEKCELFGACRLAKHPQKRSKTRS
jgi:uncharacterized protein (TIGR02757 family)